MNKFTGQIMCKCGLETLDVSTGQCYNDSCGYYDPMIRLISVHECKKQHGKSKMERQDVYKLIDGERKYQLQRHENVNAKVPHRDEDHHVSDWIIYIEQQLSFAKSEIYNLNIKRALSHIRKATALGVACMEYNKTEPRNKGE